VHGRAAHSPLLHGLPELQHAQAFAGVPVLLLEHGLRLLLAVLTQTCDQGRGFLLLHLAVAVLVHLQEELVHTGRALGIVLNLLNALFACLGNVWLSLNDLHHTTQLPKRHPAHLLISEANVINDKLGER